MKAIIKNSSVRLSDQGRTDQVVGNGQIRDVKPLKLTPHKSTRKHRLPPGWRWLKNGEWVHVGDKCCDPHVQPVTIVVDCAWQMNDQCHPVRRRILG